MENTLLFTNYLFYDDSITNPELDDLKQNFCGIVTDKLPDTKNIIYLCGDVSKYEILENIYIVKQLSINYENYNTINIGEVPVNINNVGIYFRECFNGLDFFKLVTNNHEFQSLTESNKQGSAYRKGIYLTKVDETKDGLKYNLLRCSTNFKGPTDNLRDIDNQIINKVNMIAKPYFKEEFNLNHVLAQIYYNINNKKATIKEHSDKTKDMPKSGLLAFCTFYNDLHNYNKNGYDYLYKSTSVLTRLRFRLKEEVTDQLYVKNFDVVLYPNSVFLISLETNRLYTHEIIPSILPVDKIPIRLGYVIRCSNTEAIYKNGQTFINNIPLEQPEVTKVEELKKLYKKENISIEKVEYKDIYFSLNEGDYEKPII